VRGNGTGEGGDGASVGRGDDNQGSLGGIGSVGLPEAAAIDTKSAGGVLPTFPQPGGEELSDGALRSGCGSVDNTLLPQQEDISEKS